MIQRIKDIKQAGQEAINKAAILGKRLTAAGKAVDELANFADDLQNDLDRFVFKIQPSLNRLETLLNKMH